MAYLSRRGFLKLAGLAAAGLTLPIFMTQNQDYPTQSNSSVYQSSETTPGRKYIKLLENTLSRNFPIGEVLFARLGIDEESLSQLPSQISKEDFRKWLGQASKRTVTISRLRVPKLRPERPVLDGQDIYDGFFAPAPGMFDFSAPLEGSLSKLKRQGYEFTEQERSYLDQMLKTCLREIRNGNPEWYSMPVGSRLSITSGKKPEFEIWINKGLQLESVDETIKQAEYEKRPIIQITDQGQIAALNKHYQIALICEDEETKKKSNGKFKTIEEKLYDVLTRKQYDSKERL